MNSSRLQLHPLDQQSRSLDGASPHPDLIHVTGDPETNPDCPPRPRGRDTIDELLDPVARSL